MQKHNHGVFTAIITGLLLFASTNVNAEQAKTERDMTDRLCKDVMRLSGSERDFALVWLHAYTLGKKGKTKYVVADLAEITDQYLDYCLDHPNENALKSFEKLAK